MLIFFFLTATVRGQSAATKDSASFSLMSHRVKFEGEGYNRYLKRVYDRDGMDLTGFRLAYSFYPFSFEGRVFKFGVEYLGLSHELKFKTLTGGSRVNETGLRGLGFGLQTFFDLTPNWRLDANAFLGYLRLERDYFGVDSTSISVANVEGQDERKNSSLNGNYFKSSADFVYHLSPAFGFHAGIGYLFAKIAIPENDRVPGINERGRIEKMDFDLGGLNLNTGFRFYF